MDLSLVNTEHFTAYAVGSVNVLPPGLSGQQAALLKGWIDADLPEGTHVRAVPSVAAGLPLAPLCMRKANAVKQRLGASFHWARAIAGDPVQPHGQGSMQHVVGTLIKDPPGLLIGIEVEAVPGTTLRQVSVYTNQDRRLLASRAEAPFRVAAPDVRNVAVEADGPFIVYGFVLRSADLPERIDDCERVGGPPIRGPWYAGDPSLEDPMSRVKRCAPLRPTPVDEPDGPFAPWPSAEAEEAARVGSFKSELLADFMAFALDGGHSPAEQQVEFVDGKQRAVSNPSQSLLLKSLDSGVARYVGLMTMFKANPVDDYLNAASSELGQCWLAAGLFAFKAGDLLPASNDETNLVAQIVQRSPGSDEVQQSITERGLELRVRVAAALIAPPPDPPVPSEVALADRGEWQREGHAGQFPGDRFSQAIRVMRPPIAALCALARLVSGEWASRHAPLPGLPARRAQQALATVRPTKLSPMPLHGLVYDSEIPGTGAPWTYRLFLADLFGRFSRRGVEFLVAAPPPPPVPKPVLLRCGPLLSAAVPADDAPFSPGMTDVCVLVPSFESLAAGSRPIVSVRYSTDSPFVQEQRAAPQVQSQIVFSSPLPTVSPTNRAKVVNIKVEFENADGVKAFAEAALKVVDPRPPRVPPTAKGLIWTSRPAAAEEVELRVTCAADESSRWRVYVTDFNALKDALPEGEREVTSRCETAAKGAKLVGQETVDRDRFRLVTREAIAAVDGKLTFETTLPRSLRTVQFFRFVPLTPEGVERPFAGCPFLPVAVPSDRRPPAPRIETTVQGDGSVKITVIADGLDLATLVHGEPGLFTDPPDPSATAPEFRLRRSMGRVEDTLYARELQVATGPDGLRRPGRLAWNKNAARFEGSYVDEDVDPFVRWFYWAECRMPAERRLQPGMIEEQLPFVPFAPTQAQDSPGEYSDASPAAMVIAVPPDVPQLAATQIYCSFTAAGGGKLDVSVVGGPTAPKRPVGDYFVELYAQTSEEPEFRTLGQFKLVSGAANLSTSPFTGTVSSAVTVTAFVIDPIGRRGEPRRVDAVNVS
jgi:hypothetical protein